MIELLVYFLITLGAPLDVSERLVLTLPTMQIPASKLVGLRVGPLELKP